MPAGVFIAFRDSPQRRAALRSAPGSPERYSLFGLDEMERRGARVRHSLETERRPPVWARAAAAAGNGFLYRVGGYGGDFASVLASLRRANAADVIFSTVDTVGIPLVLLKRARLVRPPIVYVSIGLPERLVQLRGRRIHTLYANALSRVDAIVAYSVSEADWLRDWLGPAGPPVIFVPFGVDVDAFRPEPLSDAKVDVVSIGVDPHRDFGLLKSIAARRPELSFLIVTSSDHARSLVELPKNVGVETDIPLGQARARLAEARVVALPVGNNSYSGATTVLLQAMAMAKPVVVSNTQAIARGYALEDGINCRLVDPGDSAAMERAILDLIADTNAASALGAGARQTAEQHLSWERYTKTLWEILSAAAKQRPPGPMLGKN